MQHEWHKCETSATRAAKNVTKLQQECDTTATRLRHQWHKRKMAATRVLHKNSLILWEREKIIVQIKMIIVQLTDKNLDFRHD